MGQVVRVKKDGVTVPIVLAVFEIRGRHINNTAPEVASEGDTYDPKKLPEELIERIKEGDAYTSEMFELVDESETRSSEEGEFDPTEHNQKEVLEYLADASAEEVARVQDVERNRDDGKDPRNKIVGYETEPGTESSGAGVQGDPSEEQKATS